MSLHSSPTRSTIHISTERIGTNRDVLLKPTNIPVRMFNFIELVLFIQGIASRVSALETRLFNLTTNHPVNAHHHVTKNVVVWWAH